MLGCSAHPRAREHTRLRGTPTGAPAARAGAAAGSPRPRRPRSQAPPRPRTARPARGRGELLGQAGPPRAAPGWRRRSPGRVPMAAGGPRLHGNGRAASPWQRAGPATRRVAPPAGRPSLVVLRVRAPGSSAPGTGTGLQRPRAQPARPGTLPMSGQSPGRDGLWGKEPPGTPPALEPGRSLCLLGCKRALAARAVRDLPPAKYVPQHFSGTEPKSLHSSRTPPSPLSPAGAPRVAVAAPARAAVRGSLTAARCSPRAASGRVSPVFHYDSVSVPGPSPAASLRVSLLGSPGAAGGRHRPRRGLQPGAPRRAQRHETKRVLGERGGGNPSLDMNSTSFYKSRQFPCQGLNLELDQ